MGMSIKGEHQGRRPKCHKTVSWQPIPSGRRPHGETLNATYGPACAGVWQLYYKTLNVLATGCKEPTP